MYLGFDELNKVCFTYKILFCILRQLSCSCLNDKNLKQMIFFYQMNCLYCIKMSLKEIIEKILLNWHFCHENLKGVDFLVIFKTLKFSGVEGVHVWQAITSSKIKISYWSFIFNLRIIFNITRNGYLTKCFL